MRQFQTVFVFQLDPQENCSCCEMSKIRSHKSILFNLPERDNLSLLWLFAPTILVCISKFHSLSLWIVGCWLVFAMSLVLISQSPFPFFPAALFADFTDFLYQLSSALGRLFIDQHYQPRWTWYSMKSICTWVQNNCSRPMFVLIVKMDVQGTWVRSDLYIGIIPQNYIFWHKCSKYQKVAWRSCIIAHHH